MKKIVLLTLFAVAIACTKSPDPSPSVPPPPPIPATEAGEMPRIAIDPADRACETDAECAIAATQCSCSCGEGVKKERAPFYADRLAPLCVNYASKTCKMVCDGEAKCVDRVCTYVGSSAAR